MQNKTQWTIAALIIIALVIVWGYKASNSPDSMEQEIVKIGVIAPLTGNVAFLGEGIRNAALMAAQELAARPDGRLRYEVIVEDDSFDVKKTASAANKLINIDHVSAIVTIASSAGNVVNPIAEQAKVVHFGIASDPNVAKGDYNFIHWTPPYEETKVFVPELVKRGYSKVAIFGAKIQGVTAVIDSFKKDIGSTNVKVVSEQIFDFGTTDFRTLIAKAKAANPDIYMLEAFSPEMEILVKQMRDAGITTPITSIESFEQSDHPEVYEGLWYVNAADATGTFNDSYTGLYDKSPSLGAGNAYDVIHLIAIAAEKASSGSPLSSQGLIRELHTIKDVQGALGNLSIDSDGFVASKAVVRMIKDGKPVTINP
ncbi:MAG: ABC transporter substrate-binding protein [Candidatus Paceibacterota bacterium]